MKRIVPLFFVLILAMITLFFENRKKSKSAYKSHEGMTDESMKGPEGEKIYLGSGGGRYFVKNGSKIFVSNKG